MKKLSKIVAIIIILLGIGFFATQKKSIPLDELKKKYCNADSKFIEIDDLNVHYKIEGEGKPVVLIHGTGAALQTWDGWTDSLKKYYKVVRIDMPAFGITGPRKDNDYSSKMYVDFLDKFLTKIGIDTFALAGNSLGGEIAWKYTYTHPEKVSKLILLDPAGFYTKEKGNGAIIFKLAKIKWLAALMSKMDTKIIVNQTLKDVYFDDTKITAAKKQLYYDMSLREGNRESFSARVQQIGKELILDISKIKTPTLTIWGKQDELLDISLIENFKKIANNKIIEYDNCGHSPQEEIPAISSNDAISFLNQ
ncbi:MAG: alpha/beta hydrolase [Chitinophagales bacterium]